MVVYDTNDWYEGIAAIDVEVLWLLLARYGSLWCQGYVACGVKVLQLMMSSKIEEVPNH